MPQLRGKRTEKHYSVHPLATEGEVHKQLLVFIVSLGLVMVLLLYLFYGKELAGKAYSGAPNTAGIEAIDPVTVGEPFSVIVKANIGTGETVAVGFELTLPPGITCASVTSLLGFSPERTLLDTAECAQPGAPAQIHFAYGTINPNPVEAKTGSFDIAEIQLSSSQVGIYSLDFSSFDVIDLNNPDQNLITDELGIDVIVQEPSSLCNTDSSVCVYNADANDNLACTTVNGYPGIQYCLSDCSGYGACTTALSCGDGAISGLEQCDDGNNVGDDGCSSNCQLEICTPVTVINGLVDAYPNCGITCDPGYNLVGTACEVAPECSTASDCSPTQTCSGDVCTDVPGLHPGTKITLVEKTTEIVGSLGTTYKTYLTQIVATEDIAGKELTAYTLLFGQNDKVLVIKSEKVSGLGNAQTYNLRTSYPATVVKKRVIVYDKLPDQGMTVYGSYEQVY